MGAPKAIYVTRFRRLLAYCVDERFSAVFYRSDAFSFFPIGTADEAADIRPKALAHSGLSRFLLRLELLVFVSVRHVFVTSVNSLATSPRSM